MLMVDLYDFKFKYKFKKYDLVKHNNVIFKRNPYPFNICEVRVITEIRGEFIGIDEKGQWWNWWEIVPYNKFKRCIYWIKFYIWYYTKFKKI